MKVLVNNMTCNHCVMRIEKALKEVGIKNVKFDLETKVIEFELKKKTVDTAKEAVEAIGYNFEVIE